MRGRTVPAWALQELGSRLPAHSPLINVQVHSRRLVVANTRLGAAVVSKPLVGPATFRFVPNPHERVALSCPSCGMQSEFRQLALPAQVHCAHCGTRIHMDARGVLLPAGVPPSETSAETIPASGLDAGRSPNLPASSSRTAGPQRRRSSAAALAKQALDEARTAGDVGAVLRQVAAVPPKDAARAVPAAQLERMKQTLINAAAHELQTPMTPLLLSLHALEKGPPEAQRGKAVQQAVRNAKRLEDVIARLLKVSQVQAGRMTAKLGPLDVSELVRAAVAAWTPKADSAGVRLHVRVPLRLPAMADAVLLRELMDHLLSNAIRFTPAGGRVAVLAKGSADGIQLAVSDTGCGIPAEERERVQEPFVQLAPAELQTEAGLGLGLFFGKAIVQAHGGNLRIESNSPNGTRVVAAWPSALSRKPAFLPFPSRRPRMTA